MTQIRIPKLAVSMEEGTLIEWLVPDGANVVEGQPLYLLGTDKVETEISSPAQGTLRHQATPGDYSVGDPIGEIE
jgi:pyruvate/2-oxoglutarate dehydrogenase complex dihydrolipoamide acyltransferase (E2) component